MTPPPGKVAHSALLLRVRTTQKVKRAFQLIWGTDRLLASFVGAGAFRPFLREEWRTRCGWFHVDQGAKQKESPCNARSCLFARCL